MWPRTGRLTTFAHAVKCLRCIGVLRCPFLKPFTKSVEACFLVRQSDGDSFRDFGNHFRGAFTWPSFAPVHVC